MDVCFGPCRNGGREIRGDLLQIQTAINPGNSGGPVLDDQGRMIGLLSFGMPDQQNMNFAIAVGEISNFVSSALQAKTREVPAQSLPSTEAEYSFAEMGDHENVSRIRYPDLSAYLIRGPNGQLLGLIAETRDGVIVQASEPGPTGGFDQWQVTKGSGEWWIRYVDAQGRYRREKAGTKGAAGDLYRKRKQQALEGRKLPEKLRRATVTFADIARDALEYSKTHKRTYASDLYRMERFLGWWRGCAADSITAQDIESVRSRW